MSVDHKLYLKDGVSIDGLTLEMVDALPIIARALAYFHSDTTITSGLEGEHGTGSYHYTGDALDIRVWDVMEIFEVVAREIRRDLRERLEHGDCYDVVPEYRTAKGGERIASHIHVEFDRRRYEAKRKG